MFVSLGILCVFAAHSVWCTRNKRSGSSICTRGEPVTWAENLVLFNGVGAWSIPSAFSDIVLASLGFRLHFDWS